MYYTKIGGVGTGFTNQIIALITSIITAFINGDKVVVCDNFLNDIGRMTYTPITDIFNLDDINVFLKRNYDIVLVDKHNLDFEITSVKYGTCAINYLDLTEFVKEMYSREKRLFFDKHYSFNSIGGDPCPGVVKTFILGYKINDYCIEESYSENLRNDLIIDFAGPYIVKNGWINNFNDCMFDKILQNISYNVDYVSRANSILDMIDVTRKINVIHLRLEDDGITHWSRQNNMTCHMYREYLEQKYIGLIQKYISPSDKSIIVSSSCSNGVVAFLDSNLYDYMFVDKFFIDREKNAIIDLLVSKCCNNVFIGNFNMKQLNGSTFSYYLWKCMSDSAVKIYIDLDNVSKDEVVM